MLCAGSGNARPTNRRAQRPGDAAVRKKSDSPGTSQRAASIDEDVCEGSVFDSVCASNSAVKFPRVIAAGASPCHAWLRVDRENVHEQHDHTAHRAQTRRGQHSESSDGASRWAGRQDPDVCSERCCIGAPRIQGTATVSRVAAQTCAPDYAANPDTARVSARFRPWGREDLEISRPRKQNRLLARRRSTPSGLSIN